MLYYLEADDLETWGQAELKRVVPIKLYHVHRERNAWYNTWTKHYFRGCMHFSRESAENYAEEQRKQGSVFCIQELPALLLSSSYVSVVITEINTESTLSGHLNGLIKTAFEVKSMSDHFWSAKPNSVIKLITYSGKPEVEEITKSTRFGRVISESVGVNYRLWWKSRENTVTGKHVWAIVNVIHAMKQFRKGCRLVREENYDSALRQFKKALKIVPRSSDIHSALGDCYGKKGEMCNRAGEFPRASRYFSIAVKHHTAAEGWISKGL